MPAQSLPERSSGRFYSRSLLGITLFMVMTLCLPRLWCAQRSNLLALDLELATLQYSVRSGNPYYGAFPIYEYDDLRRIGSQLVQEYDRLERDSNGCCASYRAGALAALVAGQAERAVELLESCLLRQPGDRLALFQLGEALMRSGQRSAALIVWRQVGAEDAFLFRAEHSPPDRLDLRDHYYALAAEIAPAEADIYLQWMGMYADEQLWEEVLRVFNVAASRGGHSAEVSYQAGRAYLNTGQVALAEQQFERAISLDPLYSLPYAQLAGLYWEQKGDEAGGFEILERYREADPQSPYAYYWIGRRLLKTDCAEEAMPFLLQARDLGMATAELFERIGTAHYRLGAYTQAVGVLLLALEMQEEEMERGFGVSSSRQVNARVYLALSYWAMEDQFSAREYACQALQIGAFDTATQDRLPQPLVEYCQEFRP